MILENLHNKELLLASQSPRRFQLLSELGVDFKLISKSVDESFSSDISPSEVAEYLSLKKAKAYLADLKPNSILITADTLVSNEEKILNKPQDSAEAYAMINSLMGKKHEVISGVTVTSLVKQVTFHDITRVEFGQLSEEEIKHYVSTFKPYDKAGSYGIQEWIGLIGIRSIQGSYQNVVGLPTQKLYQALKEF